MEIRIHPSNITAFFNKGEKKSYCARKVKACIIDRTHREDKTVFTYGLFLEQQMGLGSAYEGEDARIERKKLTAAQIKKATEAGIPESEFKYIGEMKVDEERLLAQADKFKTLLVPEYGIDLSRTQEKISKEWHLSKEVSREIGTDLKVIIETTADIISPICDPINDIFYENAVIDVKSTSNIFSEWENEWSWKFPVNRDHTQAKLSHYITGLPFIYFVFDYSPDMNYMLFDLKMNSYNMYTFNEDVLKYIKLYLHHEENGWYENASESNCKTCPLKNECDKKVMIKSIVQLNCMY